MKNLTFLHLRLPWGAKSLPMPYWDLTGEVYFVSLQVEMSKKKRSVGGGPTDLFLCYSSRKSLLFIAIMTASRIVRIQNSPKRVMTIAMTRFTVL